MIIFRCDICKKVFRDSEELDTLILYRKKIDYCKSCKKEADRMRERIKEEIRFRNAEYDVKLRQYEESLIKEIREMRRYK